MELDKWSLLFRSMVDLFLPRVLSILSSGVGTITIVQQPNFYSASSLVLQILAEPQLTVEFETRIELVDTAQG